MSLHVGSVKKRRTILNTSATVPQKGRVMSPLKIAKFLRLGGSIYDGHDEGRWFDLPRSRRTVHLQLMREESPPAHDRRVWLSNVRISSRQPESL